jgi:hypothetical protein
MTVIALISSIVLGTVSLAYGYLQAGFSDLAWWILLLGFVWLLAYWRKSYWFSSVAFFLMVFMAAFGIWRGFPATWMLLGALGGLLGWDLSDFALRLRYAARRDDNKEMERRHLARVGVVAVLGIGLALFGTFIQTKRLAFEVAVGLILLAVLGLVRQATNAMRKFG